MNDIEKFAFNCLHCGLYSRHFITLYNIPNFILCQECNNDYNKYIHTINEFYFRDKFGLIQSSQQSQPSQPDQLTNSKINELEIEIERANNFILNIIESYQTNKYNKYKIKFPKYIILEQVPIDIKFDRLEKDFEHICLFDKKKSKASRTGYIRIKGQIMLVQKIELVIISWNTDEFTLDILEKIHSFPYIFNNFWIVKIKEDLG